MKVVTFQDNEPYDFVYQILAGYRAGSRERETVANSVFHKLREIGTEYDARVPGPNGELVSVKLHTMLEKNGPQSISISVSERDLVLAAMKEFGVPTIKVDTKEATITLFENAEEEPTTKEPT